MFCFAGESWAGETSRSSRAAEHSMFDAPFDAESKQLAPVRRFWAFLVRQEHLTPTFIRHTFSACSENRERLVMFGICKVDVLGALSLTVRRRRCRFFSKVDHPVHL